MEPAIDNLTTELRDFMGWTRDALQAMKQSIHELERHGDRQNGHIELVMERERDTRECATAALALANANTVTLKTLAATIQVEQRVAQEGRGEVVREVTWLRDNVWKIALGGLSFLSLGNLAVELVKKLAP